MASKQYGLILPNTNKPSQPTTRILNPLFNSDDELERGEDEESEDTFNWIEASLKKASGNSGQKSLQKRLMKEALDQDSTVFQYDEVFDDMKATEQQQKDKTKSVEKKPKYIHTIIKHCEKRQLDSERRMERKVQLEREAEGDAFADKEAFVTPSYLKKLEELKKAEEDHKREQILEERNDVHRHKNFGVFYNHLLNQRVREPEVKQEPPDEDAPEVEHEPSVEVTFSKKRTDQRQNIRPRLSAEDDSPERITIKKEPKDSEDEHRASQIGTRPRRRDSPHTSSDESRSILSERKRDPSRHERSPDRKDRRRKEQILSEYKRNQISKRRHDRSRSPVSKEDRSRGKHRKERRSQSPARRKSIERRRRSHSKERSRKDPSDERRRERSNKEGERRREKEKVRRRREGDNLEKDKENKGDSNKGETARTKQTINMTLGATDVNKMNTEDRIQRFQKVFAKKTVGQVYEDAVQRYFQRKSERETTGLL